MVPTVRYTKMLTMRRHLLSPGRRRRDLRRNRSRRPVPVHPPSHASRHRLPSRPGESRAAVPAATIRRRRYGRRTATCTRTSRKPPRTHEHPSNATHATTGFRCCVLAFASAAFAVAFVAYFHCVSRVRCVCCVLSRARCVRCVRCFGRKRRLTADHSMTFADLSRGDA